MASFKQIFQKFFNEAQLLKIQDFFKACAFRVLGSSRYDLPLNSGPSSHFLIILIGIMTFLAVLAAGIFLGLSSFDKYWTAGLQNTLTIEVPLQENKREHARILNEIEAVLGRSPSTETFEVLKNEDIQALVSPWLGEDFDPLAVPLPTLISVTLKPGRIDDISGLQQTLTMIHADIKVDTHEVWLREVLSMSEVLKFVAGLVAFSVIFVTFLTIFMGVRTRIAEHKNAVELMHLIGAQDAYIARQFQNYIFRIALKAIAFSTLALGILLFILNQNFTSYSDVLPSVQLSLSSFVFLLSVPVCICILSSIVARFTVLQTLRRMP